MNLQQTTSVRQRTLNKSISYVGLGLHGGNKVTMTIRPAEVDTGIVFVRKDIKDKDNRIAAKWFDVVDTRLSTVIGNEVDVTVSTIEHLMSAFYGCGIDNALVEIDGPEVPIVDGSAKPFVSMFDKIGTVLQDQPRKALRILRPVELRVGDKYMILLPSNLPRVTVEIDFPDTAIGSQVYSLPLIEDNFKRLISASRTFGFKNDLDQLRQQGLARGGSMQNAILIDGHDILNEGGLRHDNEFVRHKVLDIIGDFALIGMPIYGHLIAYKPGHEINNQLLHLMMETPDAWSITSVDEINALFGHKDLQQQNAIRVEQKAAGQGR